MISLLDSLRTDIARAGYEIPTVTEQGALLGALIHRVQNAQAAGTPIWTPDDDDAQADAPAGTTQAHPDGSALAPLPAPPDPAAIDPAALREIGQLLAARDEIDRLNAALADALATIPRPAGPTIQTDETPASEIIASLTTEQEPPQNASAAGDITIKGDST